MGSAPYLLLLILMATTALDPLFSTVTNASTDHLFLIMTLRQPMPARLVSSSNTIDLHRELLVAHAQLQR